MTVAAAILAREWMLNLLPFAGWIGDRKEVRESEAQVVTSPMLEELLEYLVDTAGYIRLARGATLVGQWR